MISIVVIMLVLTLICGFAENNQFTLDKTKILKAFLPFAVILHHVSQRYDAFADFQLAGCYIVGLFFFISGYGLAFKQKTKGQTFRSLLIRLYNLIVLTVIPIICYLAVMVIKNKDFKVIPCIESSLLDYTLVLPFSWFVVVLMLFYIVYFCSSYLASKICSGHENGSYLNTWLHHIILIVLVLMIYVLYCHKGFGYWRYISNAAFVLGSVYCCSEKVINKVVKRKKLIMSVVLFAFLFLSAFQSEDATRNFMPFNICLFSLLIIVALSNINITIGKKPYIKFLSKISYEIYICQGISFNILKGLNLNAYLASFLIIIMTVAIAYICHKLSSVFLIQKSA